MGKISLPLPLKGREFHLFCSDFNAGAKELAKELRDSTVWVTQGKKASAPLTFTTDVAKLSSCDHMLVLLDARTWTSGEDTAKFVEHIHLAMRAGVHLNCVHEFPAVVGPHRHECEFGLMFGDDWTPPHLTGGKTNLYKEIALALKGVEWRQPGFVAFAAKLVGSAGEHKPIDFEVPATYKCKKGPNKWTNEDLAKRIEAVISAFDSDRNYVVSADELFQLLVKVDPSVTEARANAIYFELLDQGFDANGDGELSVEELAAYWAAKYPDAIVNVATVVPTQDLPPPAEPERAPQKAKSPVPTLIPFAAAPPATAASVADKIKGLFTPSPKNQEEESRAELEA